MSVSSFRTARVIVTGASSGIGKACVGKFASVGARVVLVARRADKLAEAVPEDASDRCSVAPADLSTRAGCAAAIDKAVAFLGGVDVLVNAAGAGRLGKALAEVDEDLLDWHFAVNVKSALFMSQLCYPHLKDSKGCIVNLSSVAARRPFRYVGAYCIAKAALDQLTQCCALEFAADGVRVNGVAPATVATGFHEAAGMGVEGAKRYYEEPSNVAAHPLGRVGHPDEIAEAVLFLADKTKSGWTTGSTLLVDGGRMLTTLAGESLVASR